MEGFKHEITVRPEDIDEQGHVNNVVFVRWVQETAAAHWDAVASPLLRQRYRWVVLRHEVDYLLPAFMGQRITGITWVGDYHGARFERYVRLIHEEQTIAEAKTVWCMLDARTGKPVRITEEVLSVL